MNYEIWKSNVKDEGLLNQLNNMSEDEIEYAFDGNLKFGTAGLRGKMGPGTNAMNVYTVAKATQGVANYIKSQGKEDVGVLVAYDSRNNSKKFATVTANILIDNGIKVYTFDKIKGVPQTSFGIRHLQCFFGIIITASHNPKIYNGYKAFDANGSQLGPKVADMIMGYMDEVDEFDPSIRVEGEVLSDKAIIVDDIVLNAYYEKIAELAKEKNIEGSDDINVVYTPLYGAGMIPATHILEMCGFTNVKVVEEQKLPNGDFPGLEQPNPEKLSCYKMVKQYADENTDLILATDPDCDRLGVMVRNDDDQFVLLTGNQVGCLIFDYLIKNSEIKENSFAVRSIVSTNLVDKMAEKAGIEMLKVLTGFRYIAGKIAEIHDTKQGNFFFGFEESNGYLTGDFVRDKDGCMSALLMCAATSYYKKRGEKIYDVLMDLYKEFGVTMDESISFQFEGVKGKEVMNQIMRDMEKTFDPFETETYYMKNYNTLERKFRDGHITPVLAKKADVLIWILSDGNRVVLRPSGTEPKVKFYITCVGVDEEKVQVIFENYKRQVNEIISKYL